MASIHPREHDSSDSNERLARFTKDNNVKLDPRVMIFRTPERGSGLQVSAAVSGGTVLVSIPAGKVISADNIESHSELSNLVGPLRMAGLDSRGTLALWLVDQLLRLGETEWSSYISTLPTEYDLSRDHLLISGEDIPGTPLGHTVASMRSNFSRQARSVLRALKRLDCPAHLMNVSSSDFERVWMLAHALVLTRSSLLSETSRECEWNEMPVCIIPVADFCNHSDNPNAKIQLNADGSVQLVALRDIKSSEELFISYWPTQQPLSCEQSLFSFGFLSDKNRFALPGIDFSGSDEIPLKTIQRLVFIDSRPVGHPDESIYLDNTDLATDYFAIEAMSTRDLTRLTEAYLTEGGIGRRTREILDEFAPLGRMRLAGTLHLWSEAIDKVQAKSPQVRDYLGRLKSAIKGSISVLNS